jgi:hypothetical protein
MATAKKPKKPARAKQRKTEATPEEMHERLAALRAEHKREVEDLGNRVADVIEYCNYRPAVALDVMQILLSVGIGVVYGENHKRLWNAYSARFHDESRLLTILEMLDKNDPQEPAATAPATSETGA